MKLSVMSTRYRVPIEKLRRLKQHGLYFEDDNLHIDAVHKHALSDASRNRVSSYSVAYVALAWANQTSEWDAREQSLRECYADGGDSLQAAFDAALGDSIGYERLADGADILTRIVEAPGNDPDHAALEALANWAKHLLNIYHANTGHHFLAARLLASVPLLDMPNYPKIVSTAIARLRWHKYLDGYWRRDEDASGKGKIIYFENPFDL